MLQNNNFFLTPSGKTIFYQGPPLHEGAKPTVIFFALSAQASLYVDPYNAAVLELANKGVRIFSWDLPFHEEGRDPHQAMKEWSEAFEKESNFLTDFLESSLSIVDYLFEQQLISSLGIAGLSRGAFIATHLAAKDKRIENILGFAPLTSPHLVPFVSSAIQEKGTHFALHSLVSSLTHVQLRFYIGNHDERVGTHTCYEFIQQLTQHFIQKGVRSPPVELTLFPSIGHKGHGTPPLIFQDGAQWIFRQLIA